ncbi:hypothetical protein [Pontixanthobacter sp.]|uniref:hypothetical protein n=1 Tax=Pontixanthobacter sp. TaxID=2792078 RepID=UPI003C7CCB41
MLATNPAKRQSRRFRVGEALLLAVLKIVKCFLQFYYKRNEIERKIPEIRGFSAYIFPYLRHVCGCGAALERVSGEESKAGAAKTTAKRGPIMADELSTT